MLGRDDQLDRCCGVVLGNRSGAAGACKGKDDRQQRDELASLIKKTRRHGRLPSVWFGQKAKIGKGKRFSFSRVGRRSVRNLLDHLVGKSAPLRRPWVPQLFRLAVLC
jgi:hypothetical protein